MVNSGQTFGSCLVLEMGDFFFFFFGLNKLVWRKIQSLRYMA